MEDAKEIVKKYFYYVYPEDVAVTPDLIMQRFEQMRQYGCKGFVIDPFNQLDHDWNKQSRDDRYISDFIDTFKKWNRQHENILINVVHPNKSLTRQKDKLDYNCPDVYEMAGGAMWNNKIDNIVFVHRPSKTTDAKDPTVVVRYAKIKKKYVGHPGEIQCQFNLFTNRYEYLGHDGFSKVEENMLTQEPPF